MLRIRLGTLTPLAVLLFAGAGCMGYSGIRLEYPETAWPGGGGGARPGIETAHIPVGQATGELTVEYAKHFVDSLNRFQCFALRFDLSALPAGARVLKAELRMPKRTSYAEARQLPIELTNVNRGLRVKRAEVVEFDETITHKYITSWNETTDESEIWAKDRRGEVGLTLFDYSVRRLRRNYGGLLRTEWNDSKPYSVGRTDAWDSLDVTAFVAAEAARDQSITLLFSPEGPQPFLVGWRSAEGAGTLGPHLVVQYASAGAASAAAAEPGPSANLPAAGAATVSEKLRLIKGFRDEGLITEEEYKAKKKELLDGL